MAAVAAWAMFRGSGDAPGPTALPPLPPAVYKEQPDGSRQVVVDAASLASFCAARGLPEPPDFAALDGVLTERLYDLHAAIAAAPANEGNYGELGDLYQAHEYPQQALACYARAMKVRDRYEWHYQTARVHMDEGRAEEAIVELRKTIELNPDYAAAYYHLARRLTDLTRMAEARPVYERFIELRPDDAGGYVGLAEIARLNGDDEAAHGYLTEGLAKAPDDYRIRFQLAQYHQRRGEQEEYQRHFAVYQRLPRRSHLDDPLSWKVRWAGVTPNKIMDIVHDLQLQQRYPQVAEICTKALEKRPRNAELWSRLAVSCGRMGLRDKALPAAEKGVELAPDDPESWTALAEVRLGDNQPEAAIVAADRAVALDASRDYPYWIKGQCLRRMNRLEDAADAYQLASDRNPDNFVNAMSLAEALLELDRLEEARAAYVRASRAAAGHPQALAGIEKVDQLLAAQTRPAAEGVDQP